jgi:hypothetical protein
MLSTPVHVAVPSDCFERNFRLKILNPFRIPSTVRVPRPAPVLPHELFCSFCTETTELSAVLHAQCYVVMFLHTLISSEFNGYVTQEIILMVIGGGGRGGEYPSFCVLLFIKCA